MIALVLIVGCNLNKPIACTQDVKICADGTTVSSLNIKDILFHRMPHKMLATKTITNNPVLVQSYPAINARH